jgi:hypothetical protein
LQPEIREYEAVAFDHDARVDVDAIAEHRARHSAGVKFSALTARIDACRQIVQQRTIESPPCE